ncbi:MAG: hypothetical protein ISS79_13700, partial [Phycisphaerae bacterium]|nr:hypothetical protein [Phycisphaerae bacterium]
MDGKRNLCRFNAGVRLWALLLLTAVALWPAIVRGRAVDFARRLEDAIDQTKSELEAEKARITKEEQDRQKELDENRAACRKLADEVVERRISIARKQAALRQVRGQRETLWAERTQWREDLSQIRLICGEVERELRELVGVLPVSEDRQSQLGQLANIEKALVEGKYEGMIEPVFAVVASLLHETRSTSVYSADVVDPAGLRRSARLLRVGQNLFGYHIADTSQTAIAICDPYQEGGFRWREGLGQPMVRAVISAIEQAQTHSGVYPLPIDVTGAMTAPIGLR